jgi:hypothetical protein
VLEKGAQGTLGTDPAFAAIDANAQVVTWAQIDSRRRAATDDLDPEVPSKFDIRCLLQPVEPSAVTLSRIQEAKLAALGVTGPAKPPIATKETYNEIWSEQEARLAALGVTGSARPPRSNIPTTHTEIPPWRRTQHTQKPGAVFQSPANLRWQHHTKDRTISSPPAPISAINQDYGSSNLPNSRKRPRAADFYEGEVRHSRRSKPWRMK